MIALHALQESSRPATSDGDAGTGEFDLFRRSERLPVAVVTEGVASVDVCRLQVFQRRPS
jgi:hypothetical protein